MYWLSYKCKLIKISKIFFFYVLFSKIFFPHAVPQMLGQQLLFHLTSLNMEYFSKISWLRSNSRSFFLRILLTSTT